MRENESTRFALTQVKSFDVKGMLVPGYYVQIPWYQVLFSHVSPLLSEYDPSGQIVFDHVTLVKFAATSVASVRSANAKLASVKSIFVKMEFNGWWNELTILHHTSNK